MTDKEFRRLSRTELVEIIFELQKREQDYQAKIAALEQQLNDRELKLSQAGSIAEAALGLNEVFQRAQAAADQYLAEVKRIHDDAQANADQLLADANQQAAKHTAQTQEERENILTQAKEEAEAILAQAKAAAEQAKADSEAMLTQAKADSQAMIAQAKETGETIRKETDAAVAARTQAFEQKAQELLAAHSELRTLLQGAWEGRKEHGTQEAE